MASSAWLEFVRGATSMRARSSALHPLIIAFVWSLVALMGCAIWHAPDPILWTMIIITAAIALVFLFGFAYFACKCPDNLRSERFVLRREEIARLGDSATGLRDIPSPGESGGEGTPKLLEGPAA